jgi:hypothetical protein
LSTQANEKHASLAACWPHGGRSPAPIGSRLKPHKPSAPRKPGDRGRRQRLGRAPAGSGEGWTSAAFAGWLK